MVWIKFGFKNRFLSLNNFCFSLFAEILDQDVWAGLCDVRDVRLKKLVRQLPQILEASCEKNTIKSYNLAYRRFKVWAQGFIELSYLPASDKSVALYILSLIPMGKS